MTNNMTIIDFLIGELTDLFLRSNMILCKETKKKESIYH